MSTRINLLPWRDELRKKRERDFYALLGAAVAVGALSWFIGHSYLDGRIEHQNARNRLLESEIATLDKRIVQIKDLETTKQRLIARMNVIQELQQGRPQIVHLFHQFVTTLPDGLYLTGIQEQGQTLTLSGVAESNSRVSNYMENLDASDWLMDPDLSVIEVEERGGARISDFTLTVEPTQPKTDGIEQEGAG